MLQITNLDVPTLTRHIEELKVYLDKMVDEKQSPIKIQKYRYQIQQLNLLLKSKTSQTSFLSSKEASLQTAQHPPEN